MPVQDDRWIQRKKYLGGPSAITDGGAAERSAAATGWQQHAVAAVGAPQPEVKEQASEAKGGAYSGARSAVTWTLAMLGAERYFSSGWPPAAAARRRVQ